MSYSQNNFDLKKVGSANSPRILETTIANKQDSQFTIPLHIFTIHNILGTRGKMK